MEVQVFNHPGIKLQGIAYYTDCYTFWDLNHSAKNFESSDYEDIIANLKNGNHKFFRNDSTWAVLKFEKYNHDYQEYYNHLSSNVKRDIQTAENFKFYLKPYNFNDFLFDFSEINYSNKKRKGEAVNPWYLQEPSVFKGSHSQYQHEWEDENHYSQWYGVFKYLKHYKQGSEITNEKLYAYCKIAREGEVAWVHLIWAHADYLKKGLMFYLICGIVEVLMKDPSIKCLVYGGISQFPQWKKRMLFIPDPIKINL